MAAEETDIVVFRTRLRPTKAQEALLYRNCAGCRFVYNHMLQIQKERHEVFSAAREKFLADNPTKTKKEFKPSDSEKLFDPKHDLKKLLPILKKEDDTSWLAELDSQILQEAVLVFNKSWKMFTKRKGGYPRFRNRDMHNGFGRANGHKAKLIREKRFTLSNNWFH